MEFDLLCQYIAVFATKELRPSLPLSHRIPIPRPLALGIHPAKKRRTPILRRKVILIPPDPPRPFLLSTPPPLFFFLLHLPGRLHHLHRQIHNVSPLLHLPQPTHLRPPPRRTRIQHHGANHTPLPAVQRDAIELDKRQRLPPRQQERHQLVLRHAHAAEVEIPHRRPPARITYRRTKITAQRQRVVVVAERRVAARPPAAVGAEVELEAVQGGRRGVDEGRQRRRVGQQRAAQRGDGGVRAERVSVPREVRRRAQAVVGVAGADGERQVRDGRQGGAERGEAGGRELGVGEEGDVEGEGEGADVVRGHGGHGGGEVVERARVAAVVADDGDGAVARWRRDVARVAVVEALARLAAHAGDGSQGGGEGGAEALGVEGAGEDVFLLVVVALLLVRAFVDAPLVVLRVRYRVVIVVVGRRGG